MTNEEWQANRPALSRHNLLVFEVWNFCGGWNPQALPLALAYFDAPDAELLLDQLLLLRQKFAAHEEAKARLRGPAR